MSSKTFKDIKRMLGVKKIMYPLYLFSCIIINIRNGENIYSTFADMMNQLFGISTPGTVLIIYLIYYYIIWAALTMILLALILYAFIRFINFIQDSKKTPI